MENFCTAQTGRPTMYPSSISGPIRKLRASRRARAPGRWRSCPPQSEAGGESFSDDEDLLGSDAAGKTVLEGSRPHDGGPGERDRLFVAQVRRPRHAAVQGVADVGAGFA